MLKISIPNLRRYKTIIERLAPLVKSRLQEKPGKITRGFFSKFARGTMDRIELSQLKKTIRYTYNTSPYYHRLFKENGLKPGDIKKFSDMTKIPYTKTKDLQNDPKSFFSVPEDRFIRVFTTSG